MLNCDIINGDCIEELQKLESESVHAVVTDPPYGIAFMRQSWDDYEPKEYQEWCEAWAKECLRVLKPGGHLIAFSSNRTHHRLFSGIEDAGLVIRDTLTWHYGTGLPKGSSVRSHISRYTERDGNDWDGWSTQLKPATEFIVHAQKPVEGAVYRNCIEQGVGALDIDSARVPATESIRTTRGTGDRRQQGDIYSGTESETTKGQAETEARFPSNLLLSDGGVDVLSKQRKDAVDYFPTFSEPRFLYSPKVSTSERTHDGSIDNNHPTVKPVDLMEWLVDLVTRDGQIVVDPFAGSGTTGLACHNLNRECVMIEQDAEYVKLIRQRLDSNKQN